MFTRILLIALCFSLLISCNKTDSERTAAKEACSRNLENNEIEATSLVVTSLVKQNFPEKKTLVIVNQTIADHLQRNLPESLKSNSDKFTNFQNSIAEDFAVKNQTARSFEKVLKIPYKYEFITEGDFNELAKINPYKDKTDPLSKKVPGSTGLTGIVGFSRAGFNEDFTKAVIYAFRWYDHGSFFYLEKQNCEWQIKQEQMIWMH